MYTSSIVPLFPLHVKPNEKHCLNGAFVNTSDSKPFTLVDSVTYIWVLTEDRKVLLGIEHVDRSPEAFTSEFKETVKNYGLDLQAKAEDKAKSDSTSVNEVMSKLGKGHATLSTKVDAQGQVQPEKAYIGGELYADQGVWRLNNKSGRYHHVLEGNKAAIEEFLKESKNIIDLFFGIKAEISILGKKDCQGLWNRMLEKELNGENAPRTIEERAIRFIRNAVFKKNFGNAEQIGIEKLLTEQCKHFKLNQIIDYCESPDFKTQIDTVCPSNKQMPDLYLKLKEVLDFLKSVNLSGT